MNFINIVLILSGVLLNAGAQLLLKAGTNSLGVLALGGQPLVATALRAATEPHIVGGIACYLLSLPIWIVALSRVEVSTAYPMLSIGYALNAVAAWYLFGELLPATKLAGIAAIMAGVVLITRS